jgi:hypothetical protein
VVTIPNSEALEDYTFTVSPETEARTIDIEEVNLPIVARLVDGDFETAACRVVEAWRGNMTDVDEFDAAVRALRIALEADSPSELDIDPTTHPSYVVAAMPSFEEAWKQMEAQGFNYGEDALEGVGLGYDMAKRLLVRGTLDGWRGEPA